MKLRFPLVAAAILLAALAVSTPASAANKADEELRALELHWVDSLVQADTDALNDLLADNYVDTNEAGSRTDKAAIINDLKSGDLKFSSILIPEMRFHVYGDFAVVTGTGMQTGTYKSQSLSPRIVFTDSFVRQKGAWHAVASQRTALLGN